MVRAYPKRLSEKQSEYGEKKDRHGGSIASGLYVSCGGAVIRQPRR